MPRSVHVPQRQNQTSCLLLEKPPQEVRAQPLTSQNGVASRCGRAAMAENRTMKEKPALCIQGMARKFVRKSIIEYAATRLIAQIMTEVADAHIAPRDAEIASLRAQLDEAKAENDRLGKLVYVPGLWRCAKCQFQLIQANLNAGDGSVTARDQVGDKCPNCDVPLWRVTEREAGNKLIDDAERVCMETAARIDETRRKAIEECAAIADRWTSPEQRLHGHGGAGAEILALLSESKT